MFSLQKMTFADMEKMMRIDECDALSMLALLAHIELQAKFSTKTNDTPLAAQEDSSSRLDLSHSRNQKCSCTNADPLEVAYLKNCKRWALAAIQSACRAANRCWAIYFAVKVCVERFRRRRWCWSALPIMNINGRKLWMGLLQSLKLINKSIHSSSGIKVELCSNVLNREWLRLSYNSKMAVRYSNKMCAFKVWDIWYVKIF